VGWAYTDRHVAWVPLAPRETYYGHGHHGPHSVNVTNVNVTNVHVEKTVYKNVRVNNAVTTVNHETFVMGKPADARVRENPFLTEKIHAGRPPIKPERSSSMPVVREVPQTKRPPEPVREVNVKQLKEQRPMVKSREASVFTPETRPREMPVKEGEAKPTEARTERAKELRQPPRSVEKSMAPAPAERRVGQPGPSVTRVETPKEPEKSGKTLERSRPPEQTLKKAEEQKQPAPAATPSVGPQQRGQARPSNRGTGQPVPTEPAVRAPKEVKSPERGTDRRMESRSPERPAEPARQTERVQPKSKDITRPEQEMQHQAREPKTLEKRTERSRGSKNKEQGG
jgi:hypothetical protein